MDGLQIRRRRERRLWLAGTVLMAAAPARFAAAALMAPPPAPPLHAILTPPVWLTQLVGPIDQALQSSSVFVLPALVVLILLLRRWFKVGRRLFQPLPVPVAQD